MTTNVTRNRARRAHRSLASVCAAAAAAVTAIFAAPRDTGAVQEVIYDLRVAGTGGKTATVSLGAPTVSLQLFAYVLDLNGNAADTGLNSAQGAWMSSSGGLLGNLTTALSSPYNGPGAQNPAPVDRDGDGDLDVGNLASASSGFWIATSGASGNFTSVGSQTIGGQIYRGFLIGTGNFALTNINAATTTQLNFIPRTGDALVHPHKYFLDSSSALTSINGNDARLGVGGAVTLSLGGDNYTWTRGAGSSSWGAAGNWSIPAVPNSTLDSVTFGDAGSGLMVDLNGNRTVAALTLTSTTGAYSFHPGSQAGSTLSLNNGAGVGTITQTGSASAIFNPGMTVSAGTLNVASNNALGLITIEKLSAFTVNKSGPGVLALGTGPGSVATINVNGGSLRLAGAAAVQNSTLRLNGGTLDLAPSASTAFDRPVVVTANSTLRTSVSGGGANNGVHSLSTLTIGNQTLTIAGDNGYDAAFTGAISLTGSAATFNVISAATVLRLSGAVTGLGGIIKTGPEIMVLEGTQANTYAGATQVNAGTLMLNKPAGINAVGGNVSVNNGGALQWQNSEQIPDSATLTLNAGGSVNLNGFTETVANFVDNGGNVTLAGGQINVTGGDLVLNDGTTVASDVSLGRDLIYTGTTTAASVSGNIALAANNVNHNFNVADGAAATDVFISGVISGATNVVKTGLGTLSYDGAQSNTYSGATTVSQGTLLLAKLSGAQAIVAPMEINGSGTVRLLADQQIADGAPVSLNGGGTLDLNGHIEQIGSLSGGGGTIALGGGTLVVTQSAAQTFGGAIAGSGSVSKLGAATLTLTGTSTFDGALTIGAGTVRVAADANLGAGAQVQIDAGATLATTASFTTAKTLYLGGNASGPASGVDVAAGTTMTVTGSVGVGGGSLLKLGGGTLDISGASGVINGNLTINAGTLAISGGRTLASNIDIAVNSSGVFDLSAATQSQIARTLSGDGGGVVVGSSGTTLVITPPGATSSSFGGAITGAGSFRMDGPGTMLLSGGGSAIGDVLGVANGTLAIGAAGSISAGLVSVNSGGGTTHGGTLEIAGTVDAGAVEVRGMNPGGAIVNLQPGGSLTSATDIEIGSTSIGDGTLNIPAGATVGAADGNVILYAGSSINLTGGTLIAGSFGGDPDGVWEAGFNWTSGTLRITGQLALNDGNGELGPHLTVGADRILEAADLTVSDLNAASLTITTGGTLRSLASPNGARIGVSTGGSSFVQITGAGSTWTLDPGVPLAITGDSGPATLQIGSGGSVIARGGNTSVVGVQNGAGSIAVSDGSFNTAGSVSLNALSGSSASLSVGAAGEVNIGSVLSLQRRADVAVNTGGVLATQALAMDAGDAAVPAAVAIQNGAVMSVGPGGISTQGGDISIASDASTPGRLLLGGNYVYAGTTNQAFISGAATGGELPGQLDLLAQDRTFIIADGSALIDTVVSAALVNGGIVKSGAGTLELTGGNDYAGATVVQQGLLQIANGALPAGTAVDVQSGGALHFLADDTIAALAGVGNVDLNGNTLTLGDAHDAAFTGIFDGASATTAGKLRKQGTGTFDLGSSMTGIDEITVDLGTLRLSGVNSALAGVVNVTGTGPTQGTLALAGDNLGSASLNLTGGRVRYEGSTTVTRAITLGVGGGTFETLAVVNLDTALSGAGGLTKTGPGTLALIQPAAYDGATNIMAGTLQSFVANAVPTDSEVFIAPGATLALGSHSQALASITGGGAITTTGAALTVGGNDATTAFAGAIQGSGTFVKVGEGALDLSGSLALNGLTAVQAGTLILSGTNTSGGGIDIANRAAVSVGAAGRLGPDSSAVTINGGTLRATGSFTSENPIEVFTLGGTIDVPDAAHTLTQNGSVIGATLLNKTGAGTLRFEVNKISFGGLVSVNGGTLSVGGDARLSNVDQVSVFAGSTLEVDDADPANHLSDRIADDAAITLAGGTLKFKPSAGGSSESLGALQLAPGQSNIAITSGNAALTFLGSAPIAAGAALNFDTGSDGVGSRKLFLAGVDEGPLGAWATVSADGETRFAKYSSADGLLPLADTDYSNVFASGANVKMAAGDAHNAETMTIRTLTMNGAIVGIDGGRTLTIGTGGVIFNGASSQINGPVGDIGSLTSGGDMLHVRVDGNPATIFAKISGPIGLTKSGAGDLELANIANDFTGGVHLNEGTLRISDDRQLGVNAPGVPNGNDIFFNGGTLWAVPQTDLAISAGRSLNFNSSGRLLVNGASITLAYDNQLAGAGGMTKDGGGTLRIRGANSYHGPVSVAAGHLELGNVAALGAGPSQDEKSTITLGPGAFLDLRSDGPFPANFGNDVKVLDTPDNNPATITTGVKTDGAAGEFQLNNLTMGKSTLATGGPGGSLAFTGIVTLNNGARFDTGRDLVFADRVTGRGSLTKLGSGTLTLGNGKFDTAANTYAGVTNIAGGVLELNKAAGTVAIPGDIVMSGGTLVLRQPRQIADNSALLLTGGTFDLGGQSDAIQALNNAGAEIIVNGATLTVGTTTISGGTTTIGAPPIAPAPKPSGGPPGLPSAADTTITSAMVTETLTVTAGATIVNPKASLEVRSGGLFFDGTATPQITLVNDVTTPGKMLLRGDVTSRVTSLVPEVSGLASIASSTANPLLGSVDMGDVSRTFNVTDANSNLVVNAKLTRGGIAKSGFGKLTLAAASDYTLGTTVTGGTLEAYDNALGTGIVNLQGGNLNLRSNAVSARFFNDLDVFTTTIDINRISGAGTTGTIQVGRVTIGASRLRARGANGGTLEFTGGATLTGGTAVFDNTLPVIVSNAITGPGALTKDTSAATLTFSGNAANTYTGLTRVNAGALQLNKPAGVAAIAGNLEAFAGGRVTWQASDQVADTANLTVNGSASRMDLGDFRDTVAALDFTGGTIATGTNGLLRVNGGITSYASSVTANITGNIELPAGMHTIQTSNLTKGGTPAGGGTAADDLVISANISGLGGINKTGPETLVLSGANSFTGGLTVSAGTLRNLGPTQFTGNASLDVATTLDLPGNFNTAPGTIVTKRGAGTLTISGPQSHGAGAQLVVQQGAMNMNTNAGSASSRTLAINATGGSMQFGNAQQLASLTIGSGATATVTPGGNKVIVTDNFSIADGATINLNDNPLIITGGASAGAFDGAAYTGLTRRIADAYNFGSWDGIGIRTGMPAALSQLTTVAIATSDEIFGGGPGAFAGQDVPAGAVILAYTYSGDANLDGVIDGGDYGVVDNFAQIPGAFGYARGDFNYDGVIDGGDYGIIDNNIQAQGAPFPLLGASFASSAADVAGLSVAPLSAVTAVPEPSACAFAIAAAMAGILRRRRRRRGAQLSA